MKIINIISDEKFIDNIIEYHDLTNDIAYHKYVIISPICKTKFKFISHHNRIEIVKPKDFNLYLKSERPDAVFIHNLTVIPPRLILAIPSIIPVIWSSWGMDIYSNPENKPVIEISNLYRPITSKKLSVFNKRFHSNFLNLEIKRLIKLILTKQPLLAHKRINDYYQAINRIDFFSSVLPPEYTLVKERTNFNAQQILYKYYNIHAFGKKTYIQKKQHKLLIGNSSAPTNNHLDLFNEIKDINLSNFKIILPLSYGSGNEWKDIILKDAKQKIKGNISPLFGFISFEEYSSLLSECSHAIFYHERQQALGNIYYLLLTGCKLYLSETSITYRYLKDIGIKVFSIQSELTNDKFSDFLEDNDILKNSKIISDLIYNKENAINELKELYSKIKKFNLNNKL